MDRKAVADHPGRFALCRPPVWQSRRPGRQRRGSNTANSVDAALDVGVVLCLDPYRHARSAASPSHHMLGNRLKGLGIPIWGEI